VLLFTHRQRIRVIMKTEVKQITLDKLKAITAKRKNDGRSDWASQHILEPLVNTLYKKEFKSCEK